jgi:antitoxin PrlF
MITSRLASKAKTTFPQAERVALGPREGDQLAYVIDDGRVMLKRYEAAGTVDDAFALFSEWASELDAQAFGGL